MDPYLHVMHFYRQHTTPKLFQEVLDNYVSHVRSKQWVVARLHPLAGICNRIMYILACTAFAIASLRAISFNWTQATNISHVNGIEMIAQSNYWDLFSLSSPPMLINQ